MHFCIQYVLPKSLDRAIRQEILNSFAPIKQEMRWFPDLANAAFCETVELRRKILHRQSSGTSSVKQGLEPSNAEFIAALAAGNKSHSILQVGCGISTVALAVAAQATGGFLVSIHVDESKQDIVRYHMNYLGLLAYVEFLVASEPSKILLTRTNIDFAHLSGDPKDYVQLFDSLNLSYGAIVAAENALNAASNEYIRHVRQQPGMESSTLPFARGLEVTKLVSWEKFEAGRIVYSGLCEGVLKKQQGSSTLPCADQRETTGLTFLSGDANSIVINRHSSLRLDENVSLSGSTSGSPRQTSSSFEAYPSESSTCILQSSSSANLIVDVISRSLSSCSDERSINVGNPSTESNKGTSVFKVSFRNNSSETRVTITGVNRDMLLSDITTAFSEMGISVIKANIETHDDSVKDIFYVIDAKSKTPLHPSQWNVVRKNILKSIGKRCVNQSVQE